MIQDSNPSESKVKTLIMKSKGEKFDISSGPSRMNTGAFDCIDDSIMGVILSGLSFTERVQAVTSVCKAWIEFKDSMPFLWTSLSWKVFNPDGRRKNRAVDIAQAISFIPNLQDLTEMRLISTKEDGAKGNAIMKHFFAQKVTPRLRRIELQGEKINITAINSLAKICGDDLKEFACTSMTSSNKVSLEPILKKASGLTHLTMSADMNTNLSLCVNILSEGRNGQPTLLQSIDLSGSSWGCLDHNFFDSLSKLCPELETLKVGRLGIPGIPFPGSSGDERRSPWSFPTHLFKTPLEPFRRLKTFSTNSTVRTYHLVYHSSEQSSQILHWLLGSMPVLEDFQFGIGACSQTSYSKRELKTNIRPPYPYLGQGLQELPRSIRRITLFDFDVDEMTLEPLLEYPAIEYVALLNCGPMLNSMQRLSIKHEHYQFEGKSTTAFSRGHNPFLHLDEKNAYLAIRLYRDASCLPAPLDKNNSSPYIRGLIQTLSEQNQETGNPTSFRDVRDVPV